MTTVTAIYSGGRIPLPVGTSAEQAKEILAVNYPELENANVSESIVNGNKEYTFTIQSGTKGNGAIVAIYSGGRIPLPAGTSMDQAKEILAVNYPELENANVSESIVNGVKEYTFTIQSGTKGS